MGIEEAIKKLEYHQRYRLGAETKMLNPKVYTEALDVVIAYAKACLNKENGWVDK